MEVLRKVLLILVFAALINEDAVSAKDHTVGGSSGWDESTDFNSWASGETFKVGDKLVFKYSTMHSVVELGDESAYKSCGIGSAVDSMKGGNSVVKLDKPGTRYFACGTMGHCDQGMKVKIKTVSASSTPSSSSTTSSSSSTPTSTSKADEILHPLSLSIFMAVLVASAMIFTMF
ncbi:mavicyanin [Heracleum sosnowskyi]|uniref:Mavicyanin n=1 Tax=Heracleum sosnowskyi TaxID=360622 RepID=A0AAD8MBW6_9APIA|nr:mavicyanin [Heracleum sosnowskyi]